jgi:hypothetical protein
MLYLAGQLSVPALGVVAIALSALEAFFLPALQSTQPRFPIPPRACAPHFATPPTLVPFGQ